MQLPARFEVHPAASDRAPAPSSPHGRRTRRGRTSPRRAGPWPSTRSAPCRTSPGSPSGSPNRRRASGAWWPPRRLAGAAHRRPSAHKERCTRQGEAESQAVHAQVGTRPRTTRSVRLPRDVGLIQRQHGPAHPGEWDDRNRHQPEEMLRPGDVGEDQARKRTRRQSQRARCQVTDRGSAWRSGPRRWAPWKDQPSRPGLRDEGESEEPTAPRVGRPGASPRSTKAHRAIDMDLQATARNAGPRPGTDQVDAVCCQKAGGQADDKASTSGSWPRTGSRPRTPPGRTGLQSPEDRPGRSQSIRCRTRRRARAPSGPG